MTTMHMQRQAVIKATDSKLIVIQILSGLSDEPDECVLKSYADRMLADGVSRQRQQSRLHIARDFLRWLRSASLHDDGRHAAASELAFPHEAMQWDFRETYLRQVFPDRDSRAEGRFDLNAFLRFVWALAPPPAEPQHTL
jgi:hypothetical protein